MDFLNTDDLISVISRPPSLGTYMEILIVLALILATLIVSKNNTEDKTITSDTYNLSIAVIIFSFFAFIGMMQTMDYFLIIPFMIYAALPIALPILIITTGHDNEITEAINAVAITTLCITIYYMIISGMITRLINIQDMSQSGFRRKAPRKYKKSGCKRKWDGYESLDDGFGFGSILGF
jgi:hypothetical protein